MRLLAAILLAIVLLPPSSAVAADARWHRDFTNYSVLVEPSNGALLTRDGRNLCSLAAGDVWPPSCTSRGRWVMADDITTRAGIQTFASKARSYGVRVVWAPAYPSLDGYAAGFGGVVVVQAEFKQCDPATYRRVVLDAVADVHGRVPVLAEYILGDQGAIDCTAQARRSWFLVKGSVDGNFVLDFRRQTQGTRGTGPRARPENRFWGLRPLVGPPPSFDHRVTSKAR